MLLNKTFRKTFVSEPVHFLPNFVSPNHSSMASINIEYNGVLDKLIDNLKHSSPTGDRNINSKILKSTKYKTSET